MVPAVSSEPPADVKDRFEILRDAGWRWISTVSKGVAYNPTTREQITYDELRGMTPEAVRDRAKGVRT